MITLHTARTGNGHRVSIMLEEVGLPYRPVTVDFARNEHREGPIATELAAANPMAQIPAIVDPDGPAGELRLGESAAILAYLARKTGRLLPQGAAEQAELDRWVAICCGGLQSVPVTIYFARILGEDSHAPLIAHQQAVGARYLATMDARLARVPFLAGDTYTYADILGFTLVRGALPMAGLDISAYPAICAWRDRLAARPAVQRGLAVPA